MKTYELDYVGTVEEAHAYAVALTVVFGVKIDRVEREWANGNPCVFIVDDVAFLFIQVLLVSLLLDGLMQRRAREGMLNKLNMIIGAFFSECGTELLGLRYIRRE